MADANVAPAARQRANGSFEHPPLPPGPARPTADCSPEALLAIARHVGDIQSIAALSLQPPKGAGAPTSRRQPKSPAPANAARPSDACLTPEGAFMANETRGSLPDRVSACMSQDGPFDAEWDMVNSGLISLAVCLDCTRPAADRRARCEWVAGVLDRAQKAARERMGPK